MEFDFPIDFVIPWVDGNDPAWQKEKAKYLVDDSSDGREVRFRDWENLRFWFRCVEKNAAWVNKIHFITWGHLPDWLNTIHPKLNIVNHKDYIPPEYLPTFNSHTIELNMHRIPGLSEHFVYFNDDIFITHPVSKKDFFKKGLPCDTFALNCIFFGYDSVGHIHGSDIEIINKHFKKETLYKTNFWKYFSLQNGWKNVIRTMLLLRWPWFPGFYYQHLANSYIKSTLKTVWQLEPEILSATCKNKFRSNLNVNQWVFKFWQLTSGNFMPRSTSIGRCYHIKDSNYKGACLAIKNSRYKLLCLNDTMKTTDFEKKKRAVLEAFKEMYPCKSEFERDDINYD